MESAHEAQLIHFILLQQTFIIQNAADSLHTKESFNMKKHALKISMACLSLMAANAAQAQQVNTGDIQFEGQISNTTCTINANDRSQQVQLGLATPAALATAGSFGPIKNFTIRLTGCNAGAVGAQSVAVKFDAAGSSLLTSSGRLSTNLAEIHVQVLQRASLTAASGVLNPLDMNLESQTGVITSGNVVLNFGARLFADSAYGGQGGVITADARFKLVYS